MTCSFKCILKRRMITDGLAHPLNVCNLCLTILNSFNIFSKCFRTTDCANHSNSGFDLALILCYFFRNNTSNDTIKNCDQPDKVHQKQLQNILFLKYLGA